MDTSHPTMLPIIARLMDDVFNVRQSWIEPKASTGETIDVLSVAERSVIGLAEDLDIYAGMVITSEYKSSVADLRADGGKPWRQPHARAIGDLRWYWIQKDGAVRLEHVDENTGWGVVMFDDHHAEIVRPPEVFHRVNTWSQTALLVKLLGSSSYRRPSDAALSSRVQGANRCAVNEMVEKAIELVQKGPLTTGQIKQMIGFKGSGAKLADELRGTNKLQQVTPGGNWSIKE